jgi:hypothetical protein
MCSGVNGFNRAQGALVWEYLLLPFGDVKGVTIQTRRRLGRPLFVLLFLVAFSFPPCRSGSNFFLLVSTSVLDRSADQPPLFSVKALSLIQTNPPSAREPRSTFFFNCVVFVYYLDTGNLEARALPSVPRLSSNFHVPGSLVTPCTHDCSNTAALDTTLIYTAT